MQFSCITKQYASCDFVFNHLKVQKLFLVPGSYKTGSRPDLAPGHSLPTSDLAHQFLLTNSACTSDLLGQLLKTTVSRPMPPSVKALQDWNSDSVLLKAPQVIQILSQRWRTTDLAHSKQLQVILAHNPIIKRFGTTSSLCSYCLSCTFLLSPLLNQGYHDNRYSIQATVHRAWP